MNLEQPTIEKTPAEKLAELTAQLTELKAKQAEMIDFGQVDKSLDKKIENLEEQVLIEQGGGMMEKVGVEIKKENEINQKFTEFSIAGAEKDITDKEERLKEIEKTIRDQDIEVEEFVSGGNLTAEKKLNFLISKTNLEDKAAKLKKEIKSNKEDLEIKRKAKSSKEVVAA